jgi:DNA-binding NtrC family response regulator
MPSNSQKQRVLFIDDEPSILSAFKAFFAAKFEVLTFSSPLEFLKHLQGSPEVQPDLVITDLSMPDMVGTEAILRAKSMGFEFPSILLSGYLNKEATMSAVNVGFSQIFEKPISLKRLQECAEHLLLEKEVKQARAEVHSTAHELKELYRTLGPAPESSSKETFDLFAEFSAGDGDGANEPTKQRFDVLMDQLAQRMENLRKNETLLESIRPLKRN